MGGATRTCCCAQKLFQYSVVKDRAAADRAPERGRSGRRQDSILVGLGGIEPPTSPLSGVRSSHLSYRPVG